MEIYWKTKDIPELKNLSDFDGKEVWVATAGKRLLDPLYLLLVPAMFLIVGLGVYLGDLLLPFRFGSSIGGGLLGAMASMGMNVVMNGRGRRHLAEEIRRRGLDVSSDHSLEGKEHA